MDHGRPRISSDLKQLAYRHPHLKKYLKDFKGLSGEFPELIDEPDHEHEAERPNVIYQVSENAFVHIYRLYGEDMKYMVVEPKLSSEEEEVYGKVKDRMLDKSAEKPPPSDEKEFRDFIEELLNENLYVEGSKTLKDSKSGVLGDKFSGGSEGKLGVLSNLRSALSRAFGGEKKIPVGDWTYKKIRYHLNRDIVGVGPIEPLLRDKSNEDIHIVGSQTTNVENDVFGLIKTNVGFNTDGEFDQWIRSLSERVGNPASDSNPIVDAKLPDDSRLNVIYPDDVSLKGPSLTIRESTETPLSIFQLTKWGTLSPLLTAYIWILLENDMSVAVCGETAAGKTTTLNASLSFIPEDSKIYTTEETPEVLPPHDLWQQLISREGEGEEGNVELSDLTIAALRARPDYIIVGEVRGEEGFNVFQAMQTGHPVMFTFHAGDITSMIQRFTGDPINVPTRYFGNLSAAIFQNYMSYNGEDVRRVTGVHEIEGYSEDLNGVVSKEVFNWDPSNDSVEFTGMNNSYLLEEKISEDKGYTDPRRAYEDLEERKLIVERAINEGILEYHDVNKLINNYQREGKDGLPFSISTSNQ